MRGRGSSKRSACVAVALAALGSTAIAGQAAAEVELDREATLAYVHDRAIENLDPDRTTTGQPLAFFFPIYDRLIHLTPDGELLPGLAVERRFIDAGATLELVLREGVVFHDGTPFDAEAVAYNIHRSGHLPDGDQTSRNNVAPIAEVEVVDQRTVRLHRDPAPEHDIAWGLLEVRLAENIGMMVSPAAADNPDFDQRPVGAGPFRVVDFTNERVVYERFDDYWDPDSVLVQGLHIYQDLTSDTVLAGIRSGRFDLGVLQDRQIPQAESAGVAYDVKETNTIFQLWVNHSRPPLDDVNIRRALLYGIDREAIVQALFGGRAAATPQPFVPTAAAFNPACGPDAYPYDPAKVQELVAASDHPNPTIGLMTNNIPEWIEMAELMQGMLAAGGVNVEIQLNEPAQFARFFAGEFDMAFGRRGRVDPLEALENSWAAGGDSNPGGMNDPRLQELLDGIARATDADQRLELIREMSCTAIDQGFSPGLWSIAKIWGRSDCLVGFEPPFTPYPEFRNVGIAADCS
jgi:peptide/nickel transport system substrate-binding protein